MAAEYGTKEFCFGFGMMTLTLITILLFIFSILDRKDTESFGRSFYIGLGFLGLIILTTVSYTFWKLVLQKEECLYCKSKVDFWKLTKAPATLRYKENSAASKRILLVDLSKINVSYSKSKPVFNITYLLKKLLVSKKQDDYPNPTEAVV